MRILLIPDKFKDSLTAKQVIQSIKNGILESNISVNFQEVIASDGGDGFLTAISNTLHTKKVVLRSVDSLGREIRTYYLLNNKVAYIELANASGLSLLSFEERNVLKTSTYGTGLQIKDALNRGIDTVYIGLGGSATNDAGTGIASALGYNFFDADLKKLKPIGENLKLIKHISKPKNANFEKVKFYAVNDVENPLFGLKGAAMVYGKQKGADNKALEILDSGLQNIAKVIKQQLDIDVAENIGSGAAGGTAYGLKVFFGAEFIAGVDFILRQHNVFDKLKNHNIDLIITGEGKIDEQTMHGKLIKGITDIGKAYKIPVIAVCGKNELSNSSKTKLGLKDIIEIRDRTKDMQYNLDNAFQLTKRSVNQYFTKNI